MQQFPLHPQWTHFLGKILEQAKQLGSAAVLAFDLDSTLFDNLPRQALIVREYAEAHGLPGLEKCASEHFTSGWDLKSAMLSCGVSSAEADAHYPDLKRFWLARFFTGEYAVHDVVIRGAAAFVQAVAATGAQLCYVTGRPEEMREGTVESLRRGGLPLPGERAGERVRLLMKPVAMHDDDAFKRAAHTELATFGTLIAAFDNEPTHANDYRRTFPEATVVHLMTDHSNRPVALLEGIISAPHFELIPFEEPGAER